MITRRFLMQMLAASGFTAMPGSQSVAVSHSRMSGRLALNISGMAYWADEHPFSNLAFNASRWRVQKNNSPFTWDDPLPPMTEDGYPLSVPPNSVLDSYLIFTNNRSHLPVNLAVYYDGKGKIGYVGGAELEKRLPGCDYVRNLRRNEAFTGRIMETDAKDPIRNIRVYERGQVNPPPFRQPFLDRLRGMSALRFMDWMATNNSAVKHWDDRPKGRFGDSERGVPLELIVALANTTKIAPWFNIPHQADDDYVTKFAEYVRSNLDPALPLYVEYSNEVWNTIFDQADYCGKHGLALKLSSNGYEAQLRYYSVRTTEILRIWNKVFAADASRITGIYAAQFANVWTSETILSMPGVSDHKHVLAVATYFGGGFGSPDTVDSVQNWSLDRLFRELDREVRTDTLNLIRSQMETATRFGTDLFAYEGGQHLVGYGGAENNDRLTNLFIAANRDPRMGDLYKLHLDIWEKEGGGLYGVFASLGGPSKWGSWGLLELEGQPGVKWTAIQQFLGNTAQH